MNNIVAYNSILLKYVIIGSTLFLILFLGYTFWKENKKIYNKKKTEHFSQITLEKQVRLYDDYRNYINGKDYLTSRFNKGKRDIPYVVSPKCFVDKYKHCLKDRELYNYPQPQEPHGSSANDYHINYYPTGFRQASYTCEDKSYDECLTDNLGLL
jgi:hypothetical protein